MQHTKGLTGELPEAVEIVLGHVQPAHACDRTQSVVVGGQWTVSGVCSVSMITMRNGCGDELGGADVGCYTK